MKDRVWLGSSPQGAVLLGSVLGQRFEPVITVSGSRAWFHVVLRAKDKKVSFVTSLIAVEVT